MFSIFKEMKLLVQSLYTYVHTCIRTVHVSRTPSERVHCSYCALLACLQGQIPSHDLLLKYSLLEFAGIATALQ